MTSHRGSSAAESASNQTSQDSALTFSIDCELSAEVFSSRLILSSSNTAIRFQYKQVAAAVRLQELFTVLNKAISSIAIASVFQGRSFVPLAHLLYQEWEDNNLQPPTLAEAAAATITAFWES